MINETDMKHLRRCVDLAREAIEAGDQPFGSLLVSEGGEVLKEERNHVGGGDHTQHPEFALARWAANTMAPEARAASTVYTSGEHCPMCAAAHGWAGLGRIVYAGSSQQLAGWLGDLGVPTSRVKALPISAVIEATEVEGPVEAFADELQALHAACHSRR